MGYTIYVRDKYLKRIGEVTEFTKLEMIPRFNNVGSFVLTLPSHTWAAKELLKPQYGIIVKRDGVTVFSGSVKSRSRKFSRDGDSLTLSGKDDMQFLVNRRVYPEVNGEFSLQDYDVRSGTAEEVMKQYVDFNAGPNALPERRLVRIENNKGLGTIVTGRARFHVLLEFLSSLALSGGGLGFRVVQMDEYLEFQVYQPIDKTKSVFFSTSLGNLADFDYSDEDPIANTIIVGGGGEGKDRLLFQKSDSQSTVDFGRSELFIDRRDTEDVVELEQSLEEELINNSEKVSLSFTPIDTDKLSYVKDYGLGDRASVVLTQPGVKVDIETVYTFISVIQSAPKQVEVPKQIQEHFALIQDVIREVKIVIDRNGESVRPNIGTNESKSEGLLNLFKNYRKLDQRMSNLERR